MPTTVYKQSESDKFITGKDVDLVVVKCTCGILFAIPQNLNRSALKHRGRNGWQISCPLGHTWHYTDTADTPEERELRRQLDLERSYSANVVARLDQTEASLSATKGVVTKLKKRAAAGVCPCCHRTFPKLASHMASKHPGFVEPEALPEAAPVDHMASVLAWMGDGEQRWSEIRDGLGLANNEAAALITRMHATGLLVRVRRGVYRKAE